MITSTEKETFIRAIDSKDYRFDGRFFVGVKTTGVYCRPVCPARANRANIEFYRTAWAAEKAGFRPCLRCRPEAAPNSPAWIGTSAVVRRALNLVAEGALFETSEAGLAEKFGLTARHLRRLVVREIGLTPKQISDTQRLNFARTLIVETDLPISNIAFLSGFNSLRRFNDAFLQRFARNPSQIRRKEKGNNDDGAITLNLPYRPPYDWPTTLDYFRRHGTAGVECVEGDAYYRLFVDEQTNKPALIRVYNHPERNALKLELIGGSSGSLFSLTRRVRRMFDLDSDPVLIANAFAESKFLSELYKEYPGLRIARGWDPFETAVGTILGQAVSVEAASQLVSQLVMACGKKIEHGFAVDLTHEFPSPETLATASLDSVKTTERRKETIRELAKQTVANRISFSDYQELQQFREALGALAGIGPWSVEYICLRALGDTDAFPKDDLIIARALEQHPELVKMPLDPWRSYLSIYLWKKYTHTLSKKRKR